MLEQIINDIKKHATEKHKKFCEMSCQIVKGGYGEGDECVGTKAPMLRQIAAEYCDISDEDLRALLTHRIHEARMLALMIMIDSYRDDPKKIYDIYIANIDHVNNWDLVDMSANKILGDYARETNDLGVIKALAEENDLWKNRIAIVSTFSFIKKGDFDPFFQLAEKFLTHKNTLILRAVAWMLREVGKRDPNAMMSFMTKHDMKNVSSAIISIATRRKNR